MKKQLTKLGRAIVKLYGKNPNRYPTLYIAKHPSEEDSQLYLSCMKDTRFHHFTIIPWMSKKFPNSCAFRTSRIGLGGKDHHGKHIAILIDELDSFYEKIKPIVKDAHHIKLDITKMMYVEI